MTQQGRPSLFTSIPGWLSAIALLLSAAAGYGFNSAVNQATHSEHQRRIERLEAYRDSDRSEEAAFRARVIEDIAAIRTRLHIPRNQ